MDEESGFQPRNESTRKLIPRQVTVQSSQVKLPSGALEKMGQLQATSNSSMNSGCAHSITKEHIIVEVL